MERERFPEGWDPVEQGYIDGRLMDDGRYWCLLGLTLGRLRIVIAEDEFTAGEHWCYNNNAQALASFDAGPEVTPVGWSRHMRPDGTFDRPEVSQ